MQLDATYPHPEQEHQQKVSELENATASAREGVEQLTAQLQELDRQRGEVKTGLDNLVEREKEVEKLIAQVEPRIRY